MSVTRATILLALVSGAFASPAGTLNLQSAFCSVVKDAVTIVKQQTAATAYCSSFLSIPSITSTVTSTTFTSTYTDVSTTTTTTQVQTAPIVTDVVTTSTTSFTTTTFTETSTTTTDTTSVLATVTRTSCAAPSSTAHKLKARAVGSVPKPPALAAYILGPQISSACSCLSIAPSTTTTTSITSIVATTSRTTSVDTTTTTTPHTTSTSVSTIVSTISTTTTSWSSVQATTTTGTTTVVSLPTFEIKVIGGSNNGNYASLKVYDGIASNKAPPNTIGVSLDGTVGKPSNFSLAGTNLLAADAAYVGYTADEDLNRVDGDSELVLFDSAATIAARGNNITMLQCGLAASADGTCPLQCVVNGGNTYFQCGQYWRILQPGGANYCSNTAFLLYGVTT